MKTYTIDELFCGMPNLKRYFRALERESVRAELGLHRKGKSKEEVEKKKAELLAVAKTLTSAELQLLYHIRVTGIETRELLTYVREKRSK